MEPIIYEKRISWHEFDLIELAAMHSTGVGQYWMEFCRKYKEIVVHFYEDHALAQLIERTGQIQVPALIPYNHLWLTCIGGKDRIEIAHPDAFVLLPIRAQDIKQGSLDQLKAVVAAGTKLEREATANRGFVAEPRYCR